MNPNQKIHASTQKFTEIVDIVDKMVVLQNGHAAMLIEILSEETGNEISRLVEGLGYNYYTINEKTGLKKVNELKKGEGFNYLLCSEKLAKDLWIREN